MSDLDLALLQQIAQGNGHVYRHEAKNMALEILRRRAQEEKLTKTQPIFPGSGNLNFP